MLSLIRHQMMVSIKKQLLNLRFKLHLSNEGMVARNTRNRKQPEKYIPDYYFLWLSKTSMAFAMMPAKLMNVPALLLLFFLRFFLAELLVPAGLGNAADAMVELCVMRGLKLNIYVGISI